MAVKRFVQDQKLLSESDDIDEYIESDNDEYIPHEYFGNNLKKTSSDIYWELNIESVNIFWETAEKLLECPEWSDTISAIIWEFTRLPCAWSFDRLKKVCNEYVISARCLSKECSKMFAYSQDDQKMLKLRVQSYNDKADHLRKRRMKYSRKEMVINLLMTNSPCVVQAKLANELMTDYDCVPAGLPNIGTLRVQKSRANKTEFLDENPVVAICKMKKLSMYRRTIGDIGIDPFYCQYCTPLQEELVLSKTRYRRCVISIDASGLPARDIMYSSVSEDDDERYKYTFLYVVSLQSPDGNLPAYQFMSQRQNSDFIQYAMACWKTKHFTQKNPDEAIMDDSKALLLATIQCFTSCKTMHQYLNDCFDCLFEGREAPRCYIRLDRSHIVKEIKLMTCMRNEDKRRKRLFQRIFGYLITAENITEVKNILYKTFILILNKYENDQFVTDAKKFLRSVSEDHLIDESECEYESSAPSNSVDLFSSSSKFRLWIESIVEDVQQENVNRFLNDSLRKNEVDDNLIDNLYFAPHLLKPFTDFLVTLPLFSNIMMKAFGSNNTVATSSPTEVGFHIIKSLIINTNHKIRVDVILEKHIEFLNGHLKSSRKNGPEYIEEVEGEIRDDTVPEKYRLFDAECMAHEENWRNKNIDAKVKQTQRTNRCKTSILNQAKPLSRFIPILKNGHRTIGTKKNTGIVTTQTCPFDSIFQMFAACYADLTSFASKVDQDDSMFSTLIKNLFSESEVYNLRNELLLNLFPEKAISFECKLKAIDCETSVHHLLTKLVSKYPLLQSSEIWRECDTCTFRSEIISRTFVPLQLNINLRDIQKFIKFNDSKKKCQNCCGMTKFSRRVNDVIVFDTEPTNYNNIIRESYMIGLEDLPTTVIVDGRRFILKGTVEYTNRHFVAHVRRNDGEWQTYDDINYAKIRKTPKRIFPVQLFYVMQGKFTITIVLSYFFH